MSQRLRGRTTLVTGAGSGIGARVASRFAEESARVVFTDRNLDAATQAARPYVDALAVQLDVTDEDSVAAAF